MGNMVFGSITKRNVVGVGREVSAILNFSASYATGGDTLTAAVIGQLSQGELSLMSGFTSFDVEPLTGGEHVGVDRTNSKLQIWKPGASGPIEEVNATNRSTLAVRVNARWGSAVGT